MALWLARGTVLAQIRARAQTLRGRSRSLLSSATFDHIKSKDWSQISSPSVPLSANPIAKSDDEIKSLVSYAAARIDESDQIKSKEGSQISSPSVSLSANPILKSDDEIKSLVSYVTARIEESIKSGRRHLPLVFGGEVYINTDSIIKTYPEDIRFRIMLYVVDVLKKFPEVDKMQIYHAKIYYQSMLTWKSKPYITKDVVIREVLYVVQRFPKVRKKVTEETHFCKDLGCDTWDVIDIIQALRVKFKLYIPYEIVSCKLAIEYIYDHRMERLTLDEFRKHIYITGEFRESKSEFRRVFVPGEEKRKYIIKSNLDCRALSLNGFRPYKFFKNMKSQFYHVL